MKAVLVKNPGGRENLHIGDVKIPNTVGKEVLVKIHAAGVNRADILQRKGHYPPPAGASPILGLEFAGTIVAINNTSSTVFHIGDRVIGLVPGGSYAEYISVHENMLMHLPDGMSMEEGAAIPEAFLTAYQGLFWIGGLQEDDTVLIHAGASGVGSAAIQLAKKIGSLVVTTCSTNKVSFCKSIGADLIIDYTKQDFSQFMSEEDIQANIILDFIGGSYLDKNITCLAKDGRLVLLGLLGGAKEELNMAKLLAKRGQIIASTLRSRTMEYQSELMSDFYDHFYEDLVFEKIKPLVDSIFEMKDVAKAHQRMEENKNLGKIILKICEEEGRY
jgi:tumor protein p53-inducible protein 3